MGGWLMLQVALKSGRRSSRQLQAVAFVRSGLPASRDGES